MQPVLSTHIFLKQTLHPGQLDILAAAGASAVEIFASAPHFDYTSRPAIREFAQYFGASQLKLHSLHAPMYRELSSHRELNNVVHRERGERIAAMDEIKRAIEVAEQIPFKFLILHLDEREQSWSTQVLDHALSAVEHLRAFARPLGVSLAIENLWNDVTRPECLLEILHTGHFEDVGVCFDSGHAHMVATTRAREKSTSHANDKSVIVGRDAIHSEYLAMLELLAPRITTTHLHDNDGTRDAHLWPADESLLTEGMDASSGDSRGVPWPETVRLLNDAPRQPAFNLEIHYSLGDDEEQITSRAESAFTLLQTT
jgi:sugar phosphate isomerase/epimerase